MPNIDAPILQPYSFLAYLDNYTENYLTEYGG